MNELRKTLLALSVTAIAAVFMPGLHGMTAAHASEIKYVVNDIAVTSYDIQRREAFLKLQHKKGNLNQLAGEEMVNQTLKRAEIQRLNIKITDENVNAAYERFAKSNKMTPKQLDGIMTQAGVTPQHFKEYIRTQMGWNQALTRRFRAQGGALTEQEVVRKMLEKGGAKPSATEYMLQQVIFVVPASDKGSAGKRKREAEALRARFSGCDRTREFAKGLIDVTVRDLGRVLAPELPKEWADQIKATSTGGATPVRETERGIEFIGVCSAKEVSDDRVAKSVFNAEGTDDEKADELDKKYIEELRKRARIVQR